MARTLIVYAAFLRGINVGGNALISMKDLQRYFSELGFDDVSTYINSGNVVFRSTSADERKLERTITKALVAHFKKNVAVVVINRDEIDTVLDSIPKSWCRPAEEKRNIIFLRAAIDKPELVNEFKPKDEIESLAYVPHALLWSAKTSDLTRSSMVKLSSSPLYKEMTVRTLGTVQKVQALMHKLE